VRITAQLINAVTGFHLWSHTYDRDLTDVLKLQSEIAGAVASALKVRLLADTVTKIEVGRTIRRRSMRICAHRSCILRVKARRTRTPSWQITARRFASIPTTRSRTPAGRSLSPPSSHWRATPSNGLERTHAMQ
jgi:hypothetical protein